MSKLKHPLKVRKESLHKRKTKKCTAQQLSKKIEMREMKFNPWTKCNLTVNNQWTSTGTLTQSDTVTEKYETGIEADALCEYTIGQKTKRITHCICNYSHLQHMFQEGGFFSENFREISLFSEQSCFKISIYSHRWKNRNFVYGTICRATC